MNTPAKASKPTQLKMQSLLAALLSVVLVLGMMPSFAWAAEGEGELADNGETSGAVAVAETAEPAASTEAVATSEPDELGESGDGGEEGDGEESEDPEPEVVAGLQYKIYTVNWKSYVTSGTSGFTSANTSMKALVIKKTTDTNVDGGMEISVNKRGKGWTSAVGLGKVAGDKSIKIQAIRMKLTGDWAELFDVYYRVNVPGYGWMGWSCNNQTSGTLSLGRVIRGYQVKLVKKGEPAPGSTTMRYASTSTNLDPFAKVVLKNKIKNTSSKTSRIIVVNTVFNRMAIFKGSKGNWSMSKFYVCACGKSSTPTRKGTFTIKSRGKYFNGVDKGKAYTCWYWTQYSDDFLFHSVLYKQGSMTKILDGTLGKSVSHGCVRLDLADAKWIYTNVASGTKCILY